MPDPTEPIRQQIKEDVVATLKTISTDHATVGYWNDVSDEQVLDRLVPIENITVFPTFCVISSDEEPERLKAHHKERSKFQIVVIGFTRSNDYDFIGRDLERAIYDVRKAVVQDLTRNTLALNTKVIHIGTDEGEVGMKGKGIFNMTLEIDYDYVFESP